MAAARSTISVKYSPAVEPLTVGGSPSDRSTAPTSGAIAIVFAPVLVPVAIWIYTLVFAFSSLWFAHFALAALAALRDEREQTAVVPPAGNAPQALELVEEVQALPPASAPGAPPSSPWNRGS